MSMFARLRRRSPAELAGRLRDSLRRAEERLRPSRRSVPHPLSMGEPSLPFPLLTPDDARKLAADCAGHVAAVRSRADRLLSQRFDLLGYEGLDFGTPLDWQLDAVSGRRASVCEHWSRVRYLRDDLVGDHKVTWELNRQQWVVTLSQAWRLTGEPRYAAAAADAVRDWIAANPVGMGMNWASSLELAFRAISWLWSLHLLQDAPRPAGDERAVIAGMLHEHGRHIERHLSTYFSPNTHLSGEALGLLYLGTALPSLPLAARWRALGMQVLVREADRQLRADGTYFEQALWYQGYTTDFLLHALALARHARLPVPDGFRARAERSALALLYGLRADGEVARFGDDDGGRLCGIDVLAPADHRTTIAFASLTLGWTERPWAIDHVPGALAWLVGVEGMQELARRPRAAPLPSRAFSDGGLYRLAASGDSWMLVDAGPHGALTGAHAHADALTFEVVMGGRTLVVDSGTGAYVGPLRGRFRRTAAHNTLVLDDRDSSESSGAFRWSRTASVRVWTWTSSRHMDVLDASHDGYGAVGGRPGHRRRIVRLENHWIVIDAWCAEAPAIPTSRVHLAPSLTAIRDDAGRVLVTAPERLEPVLVVASDAPITLDAGEISPIYGRLESATVVTQRPFPARAGHILTLLSSASAETCWVQRLPAFGGLAAAWRLRMGDEAGELLLDEAAVTWRPLTGIAVPEGIT